MKILLLLLAPCFLAGCATKPQAVPASAPLGAESPRASEIRQSAKLPTPPPLPIPVSPLAAAMRRDVTPAIGKFICINIQEMLRNEEERDAQGIPTGKWNPQKLWVVTLQPLPEDGTNRVWGAWRSHDLRVVSTLPAFTVGGKYELNAETP